MSFEIALTRDEVTIVDDDDFERLSQWLWYCAGEGYAVRNQTIEGKNTLILMHRDIMNAPEGVQVDHINGNKLDNRKENLRLCTIAENSRNRSTQKNNNSGYKGVVWHKPNKKWLTQIRFNGKRIHIGYFTDIHEAAKAYNEKAKELFGEFASINQIKDQPSNSYSNI